MLFICSRHTVYHPSGNAAVLCVSCTHLLLLLLLLPLLLVLLLFFTRQKCEGFCREEGATIFAMEYGTE